MKKYQVLIISASIILFGCRTIDMSKDIALKRDRLDKSEQFRYQIPKDDQKPVQPKFPTIKRSKLPNGLQILVVEDQRLPIAEIGLVIKNGSAKDGHHLAGLMQLTALMLKEGTQSKTSLELAEAFANLGTEVRAGVTKDRCEIFSAALSNKVEDIISLLAEMVKSPRMQEEDFNRVKLQHQNFIATQQAVLAYVAQTNFLQSAYGDKHPYGYPSSGTLDTVAKINLKDVKMAHQKYFGAGISALIAIGDVSLSQIETLAKKYLGNLKKAADYSEAIPNPPIKKQMQTHLVARSNSPQTYLLLGQPVATQKDKDLAQLEVFQSIVAGLPTSRLDAKLREEKGWTYGVSSSVSPLLGKGPMMVATSVQVPYGADALNEILQEFGRLKKEPISKEELTVAKNGLLNSFASRYSTVEKIASAVANIFTYSLPLNHDEQLYNRIAKVSSQDLLTVANRILNQNQMVAIAVGDLETLEIPIAKMKVGKVTIVREK